MIGHKSTKPKSLAMQAANSRMSVTMQFIKVVNAFTNMGFKAKADQVMLLGYFPDTHCTSYLLSGARRYEGEEVLDMRQKFGDSPASEQDLNHIAH